MSIVCPKCGGRVKLVDSRPIKFLNTQYRVKECVDCGVRFKTTESVIGGSVYQPRKYHTKKKES